MTQAKHYIPEGKRSVTPYLVVKGVGRLIDFSGRSGGRASSCTR
jgi:hypothetical protein